MKQEELLQRAQRLCSAREYCVSDIVSRIEQWGEKDSGSIEKIIKQLIAEKFIDEVRYCRAFAMDHFKYNRWGRVKIMANLKMKKIPAAAIDSGLNAIDEDEYLKILRIIIEADRRSVKAKNRFDQKGKLLRHALARGFESHLVYNVINSLFED